MTAPPPPAPARRGRAKRLLTLALVVGGLAAALAAARSYLLPGASPGNNPRAFPHQLAAGGRLTVWWDQLPAGVERRSAPSGPGSNIHPSDYAGPDACRDCHPGNYEAWSRHPHRWMNAEAGESTVKGDFSGAAITYLGGRATFDRAGGTYRMRLERGAVRRTYEITQTIGARFFQYYVGRQTEGPEPRDHRFYAEEHVLPFGYWLDEKEWVPVVHIGPELPDGRRPDPYAPPDRGKHYAEYASSCNYCHTTFPLGDLFIRRTHQVGEHAPAGLHWSVRGYFEEAHPGLARAAEELLSRGTKVENPTAGWEASQYAVNLGISCEACHLGAKAHVESEGRVPPRFFPASPHLSVEAGSPPDSGPTHANVNWACGRCHTGGRPQFAAGMSTWNSVEYSDAVRGSCYSRLTCIDCHNPHRAIGPRWPLSADQDDASCLKCHEQYRPADARLRHTHHPAGSEGSRCMNCHMPRINEGLQDLVRTHMIYSPTRADMIEANHPNACNLCHTDRPIDWTLRHLEEWYGANYDERKVAAAYRDRERPVALGWLKSDDPAVRLVAADALARAKDKEALPRLLDALDDPHLVNRQFAYRGLQGLLGVRLADFGYRFYQTPEERRRPLQALRERFAGKPR